MRIGIIGAGAVGNLLAARLTATEADVTLVARGATAAHIRREGILTVSPHNRVSRQTVRVTDDPVEAGPQDVIILCVKTYALPGVLATLPSLCGPDTRIVPMINGIPWWYPHAQPAPLAGYRMTSVDPDGTLSRSLDPDRIIGACTYVAVENDGPGRIRHIDGQRFVFGDPAGRGLAVIDDLVDIFGKAGFQARATPDIRAEVWTKLWGNIWFNPTSVLTGATLTTLCTDPGLREIGVAMMTEAKTVAEALGVTFHQDIEQRIRSAAAVGDFKTSMLQDYEAGRRLELPAILGSVIELAEVAGVETPTLKTVLSLVALRVRTRDAARDA